MEGRIADQNTIKYPLGRLLTEGKTKKIYEVRGKPHLVLVVSKDDITAGDGAKRDLINGKARWSTATTCNVFELVRMFEVPVAYIERDNQNSFVALNCTMLPYEVVVRREAHGSYLKRFPDLEKGHRFPGHLSEIFLKTKDRRWKDYQLDCDDPLLIIDGNVIRLYDPAKPIAEPFLELPVSSVFTQRDERFLLEQMSGAALATFEVLESSWARHGGRLVDFKVEFGIDQEGKLRLADVIDNDSWRVTMDEAYIDKQVYRDGGSLDEVAARYKQVAEITSRFLDI